MDAGMETIWHDEILRCTWKTEVPCPIHLCVFGFPTCAFKTKLHCRNVEINAPGLHINVGKC